MKNKLTKESIGIGYVSFLNNTDASNAIIEIKKLGSDIDSESPSSSSISVEVVKSVSSITDINLHTDLIPLEAKTYVKVSNIPEYLSRDELALAISYALQR